jgi:hypothetical protein
LYFSAVEFRFAKLKNKNAKRFYYATPLSFRLYRSRYAALRNFAGPDKGFAKHRFRRKRGQGRQTGPE